MAREAEGSGVAFDAEVTTTRTADHQAYLNAVADADEAAVKAVEDTIAHLKSSLTDRKAQAKASRTAAGRE